jgi:hypothetical protein
MKKGKLAKTSKIENERNNQASQGFENSTIPAEKRMPPTS